MNRFGIFKCTEVKEKDYDGPCVVMACISDPALMLFFPIPKENAKVLNYVMDDKKVDTNTTVLGIYKTMIDSWTASDRYLSGIIFDTTYSGELKDDILAIKLAISDVNGYIDSIVPCNFLHAIVLAAMEGVEIIVSDKLLSKMLPQDEEETHHENNCPNNPNNKRKDTPHFPEDKKIVEIAKRIMSGKTKDK